MPVYKASGIVLHRHNLGETDKILTLLTREAGKLGAVAKGSRRAGSKLSGATELFTYSRLLLATGKSLDIVSQCEIKESFPALRVDLPLLARGSYLCELTDRLVEEREPNPDVFDLLLSALYLLKRATHHPDIIVHAYELRLLAERGYAPELRACVRCGAELGRRPGFSPALGGALCPEHRFTAEDAFSILPATVELMRFLLHADTEELIQAAPDPSAMAEISRCMRWYIRYRSERDLKSADFLDMVRVGEG